MYFKRKAYEELLKWKQLYAGEYAVLLEGARRVGKSTIAEHFAKNEYKSYILIDFSNEAKEVLADLRESGSIEQDADIVLNEVMLLEHGSLANSSTSITINNLPKEVKSVKRVSFSEHSPMHLLAEGLDWLDDNIANNIIITYNI